MSSSSTTTRSLVATAKTLYRSLLRAHAKHLPLEMRQLGDAYVKTEFRLHQGNAKSLKDHQVVEFLKEWQLYHDRIILMATAQESEDAEKSRLVFSIGKDLPPNVELTPEQIVQLEKLREEASKGIG